MEEAFVQIAFGFPAYGQSRACDEFRKKGIFISTTGVRCIWQRHGFEIFERRRMTLEARVAQDGLIQTEAQVIALKRFNATCMNGWNHHNENPPHIGRYCYGKTPMQTFLNSLNLAKQKLLNQANHAA